MGQGLGKRANASKFRVQLRWDTRRLVVEVHASGSLIRGPSFKSIGYGDTDFEAIAEALEGLARMYHNYKA